MNILKYRIMINGRLSNYKYRMIINGERETVRREVDRIHESTDFGVVTAIDYETLSISDLSEKEKKMLIQGYTAKVNRRKQEIVICNRIINAIKNVI